MLTDVPAVEAAGIVIGVPGDWRGNRPARPRVAWTVGAKLNPRTLLFSRSGDDGVCHNSKLTARKSLILSA